MSDHLLRRADELLTEIVEIVETARALPMSSSCVVPREQMLDLLDALREVMPPEMAQARALVARRDQLEAEAQAGAAELVGEARAEGERIVYAARVQSHDLLESARAEQGALLSSSSIHQLAQQEAAAQRAAADDYVASVRRGAEQYADRTLGDLVELLSAATRTAENGRRALAERAAEADDDAASWGDADADPGAAGDESAFESPSPAPEGEALADYAADGELAGTLGAGGDASSGIER